jgi:hypothetical protein
VDAIALSSGSPLEPTGQEPAVHDPGTAVEWASAARGSTSVVAYSPADRQHAFATIGWHKRLLGVWEMPLPLDQSCTPHTEHAGIARLGMGGCTGIHQLMDRFGCLDRALTRRPHDLLKRLHRSPSACRSLVKRGSETVHYIVLTKVRPAR